MLRRCSVSCFAGISFCAIVENIFDAMCGIPVCWKNGFNVTKVCLVGKSGTQIIGSLYRYLSWV